MPEPTWAEMLTVALEKATTNRKTAVPGARLRPILDRVAAEHGLSFPPEGRSELKFGEFLKEHEDVALVLERPGQDILVAPTSQPQLLAIQEGDALRGIRQDLFDAFTQVRTELSPWYQPGQDMVIWLSSNESVPKEFVPIPAATFASEGKVRGAFASGLTSEATRDKLQQALTKPQALTAFTAAVREARVQHKWYEYRKRSLYDQISGWAKENEVEFQSSWVYAGSHSPEGPRHASGGGAQVEQVDESGVQSALADLGDSLDDDDFARISVPLDLVLKVLARRRG